MAARHRPVRRELQHYGEILILYMYKINKNTKI